MEKNLIHGEGDRFAQRFRLLPWHREFLWRWFELDPAAASWWYNEALVGAERGAVKTEFFAGLALLEMGGPKVFRRVTPIVHVAAASYEQTDELFRQVQIMAGGTKDAPVERAPLYGLFDVYEHELFYADRRPGRIGRIAAVAGTNEGGKTSLLLGDELHEWTGRKARVWTVMTAGLTKRTPPGRACGMSTPGAGRGQIPARDTDPLLWRLYARGLLEQGRPDSRYLFDWRSTAADPEQLRDDPVALRAALAMMRAADVAWSVEHRAREIESRKIPWHEALRYYLGLWVDVAADSWLVELPGVWDECYDPDAAPPDGTEVVVGVDMALHHDSVGVIVAGILPDGRVGWWSKAWAPDDRGRIDHLDVFATIAGSIAQRWRIRSVTYDPRFFEVPARLLEDQGITVIEFKQSPERLIPADGQLFELLRNHRLAHPGDPILTAHAIAAAWREGEHGRYLSKSKAGGPMDLIRAGAMATWELIAGEPEVEPGVAGVDDDDLFRAELARIEEDEARALADLEDD
jgi:phage terminase large subunit-like protein